VDIPAARLWVPGKTPDVPHSLAWVLGSLSTSTMNRVVPYISIRSPGSRTPALKASDQASIVPVATGVPAGIPVSLAASGVIRPATSPGQRSLGSGSPGAMSSAHSPIQRFPARSYSGSHWLAEWWSSTYSPVSLWTMNELAMKKRRVRAHTSGSLRRSQASLGPTAWEDRSEPPR